MKKRRSLCFNVDVNRIAMRAAGREARNEGRPLSSCPSLACYFGERRATVLMDAWRQGWNERDLDLRPVQLALKGAD